MIAKQLTDSNLPIKLTLSGAPVTGISFSDVLVEVLKPGDYTFIPYTLTASDWNAATSGWYSLKIAANFLNKIGAYAIRLSYQGTGSALFDTKEFLLDVVPRITTEVQPPNTCIFYGTLVGANGQPNSGAEIFVRIVQLPAWSGNTVATTQPAYTRTSANGNFEIPLIKGSTVLVDIPNAGVKRQFVVPDQDTISLVDVINM